jgi:beta-alanine degradation protein BauB
VTASRPAAIGTVTCDNDAIRVTEWRFAPGAATGWHRHQFDYIVVPLVTGKLGIEEPGGWREAALTRGMPYRRQAGVEHDVINVNDHEFAFLEIEFKRP